MKVVNIGTGYVGLNTAAALAWIGHDVACVDIDESKINSLKNGVVPIREEGLDDLIKNTKIKFTTDLAEVINDAEVIFIAVGTPSLPNGHANLDYVHNAANSIGNLINPTHDVTIIVKSTVPIGVNSSIEDSIRNQVKLNNLDDSLLHFASNPEFLREGCALSDTLYPDRIVIGTNDNTAFEMMSKLYAPLVDQTFTIPDSVQPPKDRPKTYILHTNQASAEMIKYSSNVFLALKISYINEISSLCERLGADVDDVAKGMGLDHRIAPYFLNSGLGWGGSCFPKDTLALLQIAKDMQCDTPIIQAAWYVNEAQIDKVINKLKYEFYELHDLNVTLFGLTFKPNTDDVRNSPAVSLARQLIELGVHVTFTDPVGLPNARKVYADEPFEFEDDPIKASLDSDCIILTTEWKQFKSLDYKAVASNMRHKFMIDARHCLDPKYINDVGIKYIKL